MKPLAGVGIIHKEAEERSEKSNATREKRKLYKDPGGGGEEKYSEEVKSVQYRQSHQLNLKCRCQRKDSTERAGGKKPSAGYGQEMRVSIKRKNM